MQLIDLTLARFVSEVASPSPAPGGGSVAAAVGALGAGLGEMVCAHARRGRNADLAAIDALAAALTRERELLTRAIDDDTRAFNAVMAALKLPKDQPGPRREALAAANLEATVVPLGVVEACARSLELLGQLTSHARSAVASDLGTGGEALGCAFAAAAYNVEINLPAVADAEFAARARTTLARTRACADRSYQVVKQWVHRQLG